MYRVRFWKHTSRQLQRAYRQIVSEGTGEESPWRQVQGQIYLRDEAFVARHQPDRPIQEVPRAQTQAHRTTLRQLFTRLSDRDRMVAQAYRRFGYRLCEVAEHLGRKKGVRNIFLLFSPALQSDAFKSQKGS